MLFALTELASLVQHDVDAATAQLAHDLTVDAIKGRFGDLLTDPPQAGVKSIAIQIAARVVENPLRLRSETEANYSATYSSETLKGAYLTDAEADDLAKIFGISDAYSVTLRDEGLRDRDCDRLDYCATDPYAYGYGCWS